MLSSRYDYQYDNAGNRSVVTETLFATDYIFFPLVMSSGGGGEGMMAAPGGVEALSSGALEMPYPAPGSEIPGVLAPQAIPQSVEEAYPLPESGAPAIDSLDSATPAPVDGAEGGGTSFWQGIVDFFSNLLGWMSPPSTAHAAAEQVSLAAPVQATILNGGEQRVVITYAYDPLNRLTNAIYSSGPAFTYALDAAGNRLAQTAQLSGTLETTTYLYDPANRLSSVDGVIYTWDNNGNLLWDGTYTYAYSSANRLISASGGQLPAVNYTYSGLGDRVRQTSGGVTTNYAIGLAGGLTQVLADGTSMYLYGNGRIAQCK
jgi:YD repeat-containing protein